MKQPDLFAIYISCKECGASFHRTTKRRIFCSIACNNRAQNKRRQYMIDEYKKMRVAAE